MNELLNQFSLLWQEGDEQKREAVSLSIIGLTGKHWGKNAVNGMDMSEMDEYVISRVFGVNAEMMKHVIKTYKELTSNRN